MNVYTIKVTLPIRSYLKKFIAKFKEVEPFLLEQKRCHFSAIILEPLENQDPKCGEIEKIRFNEELTCLYHSADLRKKSFSLTHESILLIDFRLKTMFDQQLVDFINMVRAGAEMTIEDAILLFCKHYDISDDDLALETVQKMYYRARYPQPKKETKPKDDRALGLFTLSFPD